MLFGAAEKVRRRAPSVMRQRFEAPHGVDADRLRAEIIIRPALSGDA
jgi:hypothetical protein